MGKVRLRKSWYRVNKKHYELFEINKWLLIAKVVIYKTNLDFLSFSEQVVTDFIYILSSILLVLNFMSQVSQYKYNNKSQYVCTLSLTLFSRRINISM